MPWYDRLPAVLTGRRAEPVPQLQVQPQALTAAAVPAAAPLAQNIRVPDRWQNEAWTYYDTLGEFRYGVNWLANMLSRVRLRAGELDPAEDEPVIQDDGLAALIMAQLGNGIGGRSEIMRRLTVQLSVPGEGYLIGETVDDVSTWQVRSVDEVRAQGGKYQVTDEDTVNTGAKWRDLAPDSIPVRVWRPHDRWYHLADSPARAALPVMKELELVNRHIAAGYLSRLASSGVIVLPNEVTFASREETGDAEDDFVVEWVEIAATGIQNPGAASAMVPIPIKVPADMVDKIRFIDFTVKVDERILEKRDQVIRRLATILDIPSDVMLGLGDTNHWCTLEHVRIMTRSGWRTHDQLTAGEEVLTLNHVTGLSEWQPVQDVETFDVRNVPMVTVTGRRHSSTTTRNHRWPVLSGKPGDRTRAWTTTAELMEGAQQAGPDSQRQEYMVLAAPNADLPVEGKYSDALVEAVAWYFTEGSRGVRHGRRTPQVVIYQSHAVNQDNCARIRRCLATLFGPVSATLDKGGRYASPESVARRTEAKRLRAEDPRISANEIGRRLGVSGTMASRYVAADARMADAVPRWREAARKDGRMTQFVLNAAAAQVILDHAPDRVVPREFVQAMTASQLELFIDTAVRADGSVQAGATLTFGQKDPARCDAFELACILSGRSVTRYEHTSEGRSAAGPTDKTQHIVSATDRSLTFAPRGRSFTQAPYTGTIWCPVTENGTWLAEDNGHVFFTGNTAWAVDESGLKVHVAPTAESICSAITTGYLRPRMIASGEKTAAASSVTWYDMSQLTLRPDTSQNAKDAYDRLEISGDAYRNANGFSDDDKPSPEELKAMGLKALIRNVHGAAPGALDALVGTSLIAPATTGPGAAAPTDAEGAPLPQQKAPPDPKEEPTPPAKAPPSQKAAVRRSLQAAAPHAVRFLLDGHWNLIHPQVCDGHAYSCPFTHTVMRDAPAAVPGTPGTYRARMDAFGRMRVDGEAMYLDTSAMVHTLLLPSTARRAVTRG